jgi:hypothetical protein
MTKGVFVLHGEDAEGRRLAERAGVPSGVRCPTDWNSRVIIHWGASKEMLRNGWVLNREEAVRQAGDRGYVRQCLHIHGIPHMGDTGLETRSYTYRYRIPVFQLDALAVWENTTQVFRGTEKLGLASFVEYRLLPTEQWGKLAKKAAKLAVRAVYSLGLDFALVTIAARGSGNVAFVSLEAVPRLETDLERLYAEAIVRFHDELTGKRSPAGAKPLLGADPEFILCRPEGAVVPGARFFGKRGMVGCDAVILPSKKVIHPLVELRPAPAATPGQLLRHIYETMKLAQARIPDPSLQWLAGGMPVKGLPLGGHIHLSGVPLNSLMLRVMDHGLALLLASIEGETARNRRPKFGFLGDAKRKKHGGFEYRTPPSWLVDPVIARGCFALVLLLAADYRSWSLFPLEKLEVQQAFYAGEKTILTSLAQDLWREITWLPSYGRYRSDLAGLEQLIREGRSWDERIDFRMAWKITPYTDNASASTTFVL